MLVVFLNRASVVENNHYYIRYCLKISTNVLVDRAKMEEAAQML